MRNSRRHARYSTMTRWILTGCIILLIPILCAIVNFVINKRLLERKTDQLNSFMLKNIQYNIDTKLNDIQSISNYLLLDGNFNKYALNTNDTMRFHSQIDECYGKLNLYYSANPDIDIMIYLPAREFLLTTSTANCFPYACGTLQKQGRLDGGDTWKEAILNNQAGAFLISEELSYRNYGKESLVYVAQSGSSGDAASSCIFLSTSTDFLTGLLARESQYQNTILIVDGENEVIGSYGAPVDTEGITWENPEHTSFSFRSQGQEYMGCYAQSQVCNWKYLVCTPKMEYLKDIWSNMALNLLIILFSGVVGMVILVLLQWRNYRPLKNLVMQLPETVDQGPANMDEFAMVERSLKALYQDNYSMRNSLESRKEYEREWFLLTKIRGGTHCVLQDTSISEMAGCDCSQARFFLATVSANMEDSASTLFADDFQLLSFSIQNVMEELFEGIHFLKTVDDMFFVYLFLFKKEEDAEEKKGLCMEKFGSLCSFFQNYFNVELAVTAGEVFTSEGYLPAGYAKVQEANELRYFDRPSGVLEAGSLKEFNHSGPERLNYYNKRFESMLVMGGRLDAGTLAEELFSELHKSGESLEVMRYYVTSIAADLLIASGNMMQDDSFAKEAWESLLEELGQADHPAGLQSTFLSFIGRLKRMMEEDSASHLGLADAVREYVFSHYPDCNMNISSIAEGMDMSPRYMSRLFKEQTGTGLLDFINEVRIRQAEYLLKNTSGTVDEIASQVGYTNSRTFRRNFLKFTGENAANYRNK